MNTDERRTKAASQALFDDSFGGTSDPTLEDMLASLCQSQGALVARAIRESDEAAGMVLVPKVAAEDMKHAGASAIEYPTVRMEGPMPGSKIRAERIYDAMIAAAEESHDP